MKVTGKRSLIKKICSFKEELLTTMKFWPRNVLDRISNEEDRQFLISMMGDRKACMGEVDNIPSSTEKKVAKRKQAEEQWREKEKEMKESVSMTPSNQLYPESEEEENYQDPNYLAEGPSSS